MNGAPILIADDDELVRTMLVRVAEELSSDVVAVDSGTSAIAALRERAFALLVTDLRMPGASGVEVIEACRTLRPACRLVLLSGYADDAVVATVELAGASVLHKPFGAAALRELLEAQLAAAPAER